MDGNLSTILPDNLYSRLSTRSARFVLASSTASLEITAAREPVS
jgi:hypothetical protein